MYCLPIFSHSSIPSSSNRFYSISLFTNLLTIINKALLLIHAEVSVYPMGTNTTSASFYIAKGIEAIKNLEGLRYEVNPMGTLLESENVDKIFEASKRITEAIHNLGVQRIEIVLKIDSRKDKDSKLEEKMESLKKYLKPN